MQWSYAKQGDIPSEMEAEVLIAPTITVSHMSAKDQQERAIQAGYEAARVVLPRLLFLNRPEFSTSANSKANGAM
ncbi:MAG: hypothetical protein V4568_00740 [Pseudomonadota bacterium]